MATQHCLADLPWDVVLENFFFFFFYQIPLSLIVTDCSSFIVTIGGNFYLSVTNSTTVLMDLPVILLPIVIQWDLSLSSRASEPVSLYLRSFCEFWFLSSCVLGMLASKVLYNLPSEKQPEKKTCH